MNDKWLSKNQERNLERNKITFFVHVQPGDDGWEHEDLMLTPEEIKQKTAELEKRLKNGEILDFSVNPGMEAPEMNP